MGKYLDILARSGVYDKNDRNDQSQPPVASSDLYPSFGRLGRFGRTISALEARCPDLVPTERWQIAVEDGRRFLARWGERAAGLGWTARDLCGLHQPPEKPHPSYSRLSRYDETGLIWLLTGREVVALTEETAAIATALPPLIYRRFNEPGLGPLGESLDYFR
jgi:hypothetical protein